MSGQEQSGFMIPVNELDFQTAPTSYPRNICATSTEALIGAPWWGCENIRLTGTVDAVTAKVGDTVTIQAGIQALPAEFAGEQLILSVQAWVCYPNTVTAGETDSSLVVPSMQDDHFASHVFPSTTTAPAVYNGKAPGSYHKASGSKPSFRWQSLTHWTPQEQDFMDQSAHEGHCCIIANVSGLFDFNGTSGTPVGEQITANSELATHIKVCNKLYQGQRNIVVVAAPRHHRATPRFGFLSGTARS